MGTKRAFFVNFVSNRSIIEAEINFRHSSPYLAKMDWINESYAQLRMELNSNYDITSSKQLQ